MSDVKVTDSVLYVGCDDLDIDLLKVSIMCRTEFPIIPM